MTYLAESPGWRDRTEREHVPELDIISARRRMICLHDLVAIRLDYMSWYELPSQCPRDMLVFCELARKYLVKPDSVYLEVGCAYGGSLMLAAFSSHPNARLIGVDLFERFLDSTEAKVRETAKRWGFNDRLELYQGDLREVSHHFPVDSVDMLFVDSDHTYEQVTQDLINGWTKVKPGGILIGHDYEYRLPGCIQAVKEWSEYHRVHIPNGSSMFYAEKPIC